MGITICNNNEEFLNGIGEAFRVSDTIMLQEFIKGREFTCGVIEDKEGKPFALPPTEIVPKKGLFFDYKSKYEKDGALEITPPPNLPNYLINALKRTAVFAHNIIGARGFSRTDMILDKDGGVHILEINTIPGLTEESLLPKAALASGFSFSKVLDKIIDSAFGR